MDTNLEALSQEERAKYENQIKQLKKNAAALGERIADLSLENERKDQENRKLELALESYQNLLHATILEKAMFDEVTERSMTRKRGKG